MAGFHSPSSLASFYAILPVSYSRGKLSSGHPEKVFVQAGMLKRREEKYSKKEAFSYSKVLGKVRSDEPDM
ncbi:hypothetical protein HY58_08290 [Flavihumibacter sp. ZG627]|nr:hypothetical protein HY58_08290 [Flavihumibacter sp. ZG627]